MEIKSLALFTSIILMFLAAQGCRCLICDNNEGEDPQYNLGKLVNSPYDEFAPVVLSENKLVFTSNKGTVGDYIKDDRFYGEDIYISLLNENHWQNAHLLDEPANTFNNEGTLAKTVLNNGRHTIMARSHSTDGFGGVDLYLAKFNGEVFFDFKNLGEKINTVYWEAHPTLSNDGKILVFASNRPNGYGGSDLYISYKDGNSWSNPENLGPKINTERNELSPYLITGKKDILFYSTEDSQNELNIYYNFLMGKNKWGSKRLIENNVNTQFNEAFPCITEDLETIYFCSDRPGGCGGYDLYKAPLKIEDECNGIKGKILDKNTGEPILANANVVIRDNAEILNRVKSKVPNNEYFIEELCIGKYNFEISAAGYFPLDTMINVNFQDEYLTHYLTAKPPLEPKKVFDLREYNIPFFVTGYYKLNTKENLSILRNRINTDLANVSYIENPGNKYDRYADKIESIFKDSVYSFVIDSLLSEINIEDEFVEIEVFGYTDPRKLSSIYVEETIQYDDIAVYNNSIINNEVLSNLRAYYTMVYLDELLMQNVEYRELKNKGRITYKIKGLGVDTQQKDFNKEIDYDARRRVQIKIWQRPLNDNQ